jgi:ADP-ribose pyrophosphatase YjhB (NUDIX family)
MSYSADQRCRQMPDTPKHSVSVAGIVVNDAGQVLVIRRRDNGRWEPPGGVLELDESFEEGVRREVKEETGIPVEVERLTGVYKNMQRGVVALVFRCRPLPGQAHTSDETAQVLWINPEAVPHMMAPAYAVRVTDALQRDLPVTRAHDGIHLIEA